MYMCRGSFCPVPALFKAPVESMADFTLSSNSLPIFATVNLPCGLLADAPVCNGPFINESLAVSSSQSSTSFRIGSEVEL